MKKCFMVFSFVLILISLCSCHGTLVEKKPPVNLVDFEVPEAFDETKSFELTFWAKNDTNKVQQAIFLNAVHSFE